MDHVPERDAKRYGDATFGAIMLAKVLCVHLVNDLGYDLLFQDVDVIWYKNPFDFFRSDEKLLLYFHSNSCQDTTHSKANLKSSHYLRPIVFKTELSFFTIRVNECKSSDPV